MTDTWDPDHLATLNEAATPAEWGTTRSYIWRDNSDHGGWSCEVATTADAALIVYLRNHVDAILAQAAELATLRARVEAGDALAARVRDQFGHADAPYTPWALEALADFDAASTPDTGSET